MKIVVQDLIEAHKICDDFDMVISVVNSHSSFFGIEEHPNHVFEFFDDVEHGLLPDAPKKAQIENILNATAQLPADSKVLVHCMAGMCRSTAVAIAIATQHGKDPVEAAQELLDNHYDQKMFYPNRLILKHAAEILKCPKLYTGVKIWMDENCSTENW